MEDRNWAWKMEKKIPTRHVGSSPRPWRRRLKAESTGAANGRALLIFRAHATVRSHDHQQDLALQQRETITNVGHTFVLADAAASHHPATAVPTRFRCKIKGCIWTRFLSPHGKNVARASSPAGSSGVSLREASERSVLAARRCRNPQPWTAAPQEQCPDAPKIKQNTN